MNWTVSAILANEVGPTAIATMPACADIVAGNQPIPTACPAVEGLEDWLRWFARTPACRELQRMLAGLGVTAVIRGDALWGRYGYCLPGRPLSCGPCQFEFAHLRDGGGDACVALVCAVPGANAFSVSFAVNVDGTRLLIWPQNIGLGPYGGPSAGLTVDNWFPTLRAATEAR